MQWSINDTQVFLTLNYIWVDANGMYLIPINLIDFGTNNLNQVRIAFKFDILHLYLANFVNDSFVMWSQHLCTIFPISLVAIVFTRIMRSSKVDTSLAAQITDSKTHLWSRTHIVEEINLDAIGREDIGRLLCKEVAVVTAVITDSDRDLFSILKVFLQIVSKALGSSTHYIDIHAVSTGSHNATQTTRTKLQITVEAFYQLCLVRVIQHTFHFSLSFGIICRGKPLLGSLSNLFD